MISPANKLSTSRNLANRKNAVDVDFDVLWSVDDVDADVVCSVVDLGWSVVGIEVEDDVDIDI